MQACKNGHEQCASALIETGAAVDVAANNGFTALMGACQYGHEQCACALIEAKAQLEAQQNGGFTALMFACQNLSLIHI